MAEQNCKTESWFTQAVCFLVFANLILQAEYKCMEARGLHADSKVTLVKREVIYLMTQFVPDI